MNKRSTRLRPAAKRTRSSIRISELAEIAANLRMGFDNVVWQLGDDGYLVVTQADLSAIEDYLAGRTKRLSFAGGLLPDFPDKAAQR